MHSSSLGPSSRTTILFIMQSLLRRTKRIWLLPSIREYTVSSFLLQPTTYPHTSTCGENPSTKSPEIQKKQTDLDGDRHWMEASATVSEADVRADRDSIEGELHSEEVEKEIAAYGGAPYVEADM